LPLPLALLPLACDSAADAFVASSSDEPSRDTMATAGRFAGVFFGAGDFLLLLQFSNFWV
jgi:hypothetical protein